MRSSRQLLEAQVLAAIDGKRSVEDIALLISRQYGLDMTKACFAIQCILTDA